MNRIQGYTIERVRQVAQVTKALITLSERIAALTQDSTGQATVIRHIEIGLTHKANPCIADPAILGTNVHTISPRVPILTINTTHRPITHSAMIKLATLTVSCFRIEVKVACTGLALG